MSLVFQHITFSYEGAALPLLEDVVVHFPRGWTGITGANGTGKTTVLRLAANELSPQQGVIKRPARGILCPQRTDDVPEQLERFILDQEAYACILRGKLQIGDDWKDRWLTLSHGERKRAQIAVALWQQPDILLIDEPTNHIDSAARSLLAEALLAFEGIGLLVSHDRDLLDSLCGQCLFLEPPKAIIRPGNYTKASNEAQREEESLLAKRQVQRQQLQRLTRVSHHRHTKAASADRKKYKGRLARGDSDGKAKIDLARVSGKDGQAGRLVNQMKGRIEQAQEQLASLKVKKRYPANFWLEGSLSPRQWLFTLPSTTINLDGICNLEVPELVMQRDARIAITGVNGSGKSTLVRHILRNLNLDEERLVYLPQEIDLKQTHHIMNAVHDLSNDKLGTVMTIVSSLGSRPERLLETLDASPGELRKVLLALGVIRQPYLIVMDEPTNHLDLPAIECLEKALCDCPCGLLLVSHDLRFLRRVAQTRWHLVQDDNTMKLSVNDGFY